jgi:hypothetical protein
MGTCAMGILYAAEESTEVLVGGNNPNLPHLHQTEAMVFVSATT